MVSLGLSLLRVLWEYVCIFFFQSYFRKICPGKENDSRHQIANKKGQFVYKLPVKVTSNMNETTFTILNALIGLTLNALNLCDEFNF